jgi:hypothetical protein
MRAREIAETLINGNISDARREIVSGRTQTEAAVMALDVLDEMFEYASDGEDLARMIASLRRCLTGGE